uniref:DH domain-containing protein n=1 Tax=Timema monikensis TaxID=170555 RepID=A0A7R9HQ54_9NEOP|nr:unnamed protein product [Timema monikensis]
MNPSSSFFFPLHLLSRYTISAISWASILWLVRSMDDPMLQGWVPASVLERSDGEELTKHSELSRPEVAQSRREAAVRELVETEEEFGRDLQQVVERYQKPLDNTSVPHVVRENRDVIFSNFKQIADFHNT